MRILIEECVPKQIRNSIVAHNVRTVTEMGWSGSNDQQLLSLMQSNQFDLVITVDQNIQYQQNFQTFTLSIIVLVAATNRRDDLLPLMPSVMNAMPLIVPGIILSIDQ